MNKLIRNAFASSLLALSLAGPVLAESENPKYTDLVLKNLAAAGIEQPMLNISVDDAGIATLSGTVSDEMIETEVEKVVRGTEGVKEIHSSVTMSN